MSSPNKNQPTENKLNIIMIKSIENIIKVSINKTFQKDCIEKLQIKNTTEISAKLFKLFN